MANADWKYYINDDDLLVMHSVAGIGIFSLGRIRRAVELIIESPHAFKSFRAQLDVLDIAIKGQKMLELHLAAQQQIPTQDTPTDG